MRTALSIVVAAICLVHGLWATAAESPNPKSGDVTEYRFDEESVEGVLLVPDGARIGSRPRGKTRSLIKVRGNFVGAMLRSVEEL